MVRQQTVALAREVNHPFNLGYALSNSAMLGRWLGQLEETEQWAQECMAVSDQFGLPFWLCMGATSHGWARAMRGDATGADQIQQCLDRVNAIMSGAKLLFLAPLCEALVQLKKYDGALEKLNEAIKVAEEKNDRFFESEFHRLKGVCLLEVSSANADEAEACFNQALGISRQQGAKALELRAATSMAKLRRQQNRQDDGRHLLKEIYGWLSEGNDTPDLQEARYLLNDPA